MSFHSMKGLLKPSPFILYALIKLESLSSLLIYTCLRNTDKPEQINLLGGIKVYPVMSTIRPYREAILSKYKAGFTKCLVPQPVSLVLMGFHFYRGTPSNFRFIKLHTGCIKKKERKGQLYFNKKIFKPQEE